MKLISWNVNGLRACMNKGFMDFFNAINADIFCIQESKQLLILKVMRSFGIVLKKRDILV